MGKNITAAAFSVALLAGLPATGHADTDRATVKKRLEPNRSSADYAPQRAEHRWQKFNRVKGEAAAVPELDPGAAGHGLALLLAASALFFDRRRTQHS